MTMIIRNGKVWVDNQLRLVDLVVSADGKIAGLCDESLKHPEKAGHVFDAKGCLVLPGGIDAHAHIQDGAETFYEGSCAAAAGGITTVIDMPPLSAITNLENLAARAAQAGESCVVDFGTHAGIVVGLEDLADLDAVTEAGVAGFKIFMPTNPPVSRDVLWQAVQVAARTGLRLLLHAEEPACIAPAIDWADPQGFANARPPVAEHAATAFVLEMALAAGAPVHICHISSARTADLVDQYRCWGVDVTSETTLHFLLFNKADFTRYGASLKTTPPLRETGNSEVLWQALADGVIDFVVSDHFLGERLRPGQQVGLKEKAAGIAGLELSLPLLYHTGVHTHKLDLQRFVQVTASAPAEIYGYQHRKGSITPGMDADLVIFDPDEEWVVEPLGKFSRAAGSPYHDWRLKGRVKHTFVRGVEIWNGESILVDQPEAQFVKRVS